MGSRAPHLVSIQGDERQPNLGVPLNVEIARGHGSPERALEKLASLHEFAQCKGAPSHVHDHERLVVPGTDRCETRASAL